MARLSIKSNFIRLPLRELGPLAIVRPRPSRGGPPLAAGADSRRSALLVFFFFFFSGKVFRVGLRDRKAIAFRLAPAGLRVLSRTVDPLMWVGSSMKYGSH